MKIYKVGGFVRDRIINNHQNLEIVSGDCDYVVVGATPEKMIDLGYKLVGKSFSVFLHPETKDEYALARKETQIGNSHTSFKFDFGPDITLEEDLVRRDFTMNAIAFDDDSNSYIDLFNGQADIENKIIRHVNSEHFIEDPLRILRACRFAAQLDFEIADETLVLLKDMVNKNMLGYLSNDRIYNEIIKAFKKGYNSSKFIKYMDIIGALEQILPEIANLKDFQERPEFHKEGTTFNHTLLVLDKSRDKDIHIKLGCLFHDVGKYIFKDNQGHNHDSEKIFEILEPRLTELRFASEYKKFIKLSIETHMLLPKYMNLRADTLLKLLIKASNNFQNRQLFLDLLQVVHCDRTGREADVVREHNFDNLINMFDSCLKVNYMTLESLNIDVEGESIQKAINTLRESIIMIYKGL